jgi:NitT/TauT family transport system ATP-binding protein
MHTAMSETLISFENVGKVFHADGKAIEAVRGIDFGISRGEFVTIVGPSGCGKSTLLNMTAGLFGPTSGVVRYGGVEVAGVNRSTGYMTQSDHLLPWRTVAGNIEVPLEIQGISREAMRRKVDAIVALVGLRGFEKSYPTQLSGGMRKRTALARLLAYDPETLLLDEPFAALDAQLRLNMQIELLRLSRQFNKTVLFVTHDLDEAAALGDRCIVFSARPGTITHMIESPLPRDRDLLRLRHDPRYMKLAAELWDLITPNLTASGATSP